MKKVLIILLAMLVASCTKYSVKAVNSSEVKGYDHIYDIVSNCIAKNIDENAIVDITFDFGWHDNDINFLRVYLAFDYGYYNDRDIINNIVEENIINELFNIFHKESKVLKISDINIVKCYPFKINIKNAQEYSKEEIENFENGIYTELEIPIFDVYESCCEGDIEVEGNAYLDIDKIKEYVEKKFEIENDIEI